MAHFCINCSTRISYDQETTNKLCIDCSKFGTIQSRTQIILDQWRGNPGEIYALSAIVRLSKFTLSRDMRIAFDSMIDVDVLLNRLEEKSKELHKKFEIDHKDCGLRIDDSNLT